MRCLVVWVLLVLSHFVCASDVNTGFVGSSRCQTCHTTEYEQWKVSDHFRAMSLPNEDSVLGDFSGKTVEFHGKKHRFVKEDNQYFIDLPNSVGEIERFSVAYTFGYFPLQQYLLNIGGGHLQATNVAWDSRSKKDGGQRWFHLQIEEEISHENPFHWTGHLQNWNTRCADCHSTNLQKNYDAEAHAFSTTWSEINVACESCHGPGSKHIEIITSGKFSMENTGLEYVGVHKKLNWVFSENSTVASSKGHQNNDHINMCGGCHSRRMVIGDPNKFENYHDKYRLQTLRETLYFNDGQIEDEVYVLGSFVQSKMHHAGVTCMNCHNPHSGKLVAEPNQVCAQCHLPTEYDVSTHHIHNAGSEGAQCVNCHMPERTYMAVDPRRDHSFTIPNPALSRTLGVPNACTTCHGDKDNRWAENALKDRKFKSLEWASANKSARELDATVISRLSEIATNPSISPIIQATMMDNLANFPSRETLETAAFAVRSDDPIVRASASRAINFADISMRWPILSPLLKDPVRSVRVETAAALADGLNLLPDTEQSILANAIQEYRSAFTLTSDSPSSQVALAQLELQIGNKNAAVKAYKHALKIDPTYSAALLNLADYYRSEGNRELEFPLLQRALKLYPESAAIAHSMGLFYIREKRYQYAGEFLKAATLKPYGSNPRFFYVYAIYLESQGELGKAIDTLEQSNRRWPNQYETLTAIISFSEKNRDVSQIPHYLNILSRIAPNAPQVKQWKQKYQ